MGSINYFFVGYDPGTTSAVAMVDLEGKLVGATNGRGITQAQLIEFIIEKGKPIMMASDVAGSQHATEKMAARFGVQTFAPYNDLPLALKRKYSKLKCAHERDAEAAARYAYLQYAGKIRNLRKKYEWDEVVRKLTGEIEKKEKVPALPAKKTDVRRLLARISQLEEEKADAKRELAKAENLLKPLEARCAELEQKAGERAAKERRGAYRDKLVGGKDQQIRVLDGRLKEKDAEMAGLKKIIGDLKTLYSLVAGGRTPVKVIQVLSEEEITKLDERLGISAGDVILAKSPGAAGPARLLAARGIKAIICDGLSKEARKEFTDRGVEVLDSRDANLRNDGTFIVLERKNADMKNVEKNEGSVEDLLEEYRRSRRIY